MANQYTPLSDFPKAFAGPEGKVDPKLLREICSIREKPARSVRELLALCGPIKVDAAQAFSALSEIIVDKAFRERWYEESINKKLAIWPFFALTHRYIVSKYKYLDYDSEQMASFFAKRLAKSGSFTYFPKLQNMPTLIENIRVVAELSKDHAAIFCWALTESALFSSRRYPGEKSLTLFAQAFLSALDEHGLSDIADLVKIGDWVPAPALPKSPIKPIIHLPKKELAAPVEIVPIVHKHDAILKLEERVDEILRKLQDADKYANTLSEKALEVRYSESIEGYFDELQNTLSHLQRISSEIARDEQTFLADFSQLLTSNLSEIKVNLTELDVEKLSPKLRASWSAKTKEMLSLSSDIIKFSILLPNKRKEVREQFLKLQEKRTLPLRQIWETLPILEKDLQICENGFLARVKIYDSIKNNFKNISWNPFSKSTSSSQLWGDLGHELVRCGELGSILGIILRQSFHILKDEFVRCVEFSACEISTRDMLEHVIDCFSYLTLGQIETIARQSENLRRLLAIIELHAFLDMAPNNPTGAFKYWSIRPLNEISSISLDDLFTEFFQSVYEICAQTSERSFGFVDLRQVLLKARAIDEQSRFLLDEQDFRNRLDEILRFYKRGQNTYGELWAQAYATVVTPLRDYAQNHCLSDVAEKIIAKCEGFKVDYHLQEWKLHIPEHLRKRSEYDKHIRAQVEGKVSELLNWANSYRLSTVLQKSVGKPELTRLEQAIRNVYLSNEQSVGLLKLWFEVVLLQDREVRKRVWSFSSSEEPSWDEKLIGHTATPLEPRTYTNNDITFGRLCADRIIQYFGHNTVSELAFNYAELGMYEEYFALSSSTTESISIDLDRKVELEVDQLQVKQSARIDNLAKKQAKFLESGESIDVYLLELKQFLEEKSWARLENELTEVEVLALDIEANRANKVIREQLSVEIAQLGGTFDEKASTQELTTLRDKLYNVTLPQRLHLAPLNRIIGFPEMDSDIINATRAAYKNFDTHANLPTPEQSEYLSYVLEQTISPLLDELSRYRTLLPSYSSKLKGLTMNLMANLEKMSLGGLTAADQISILEGLADNWSHLPRQGENGIDIISAKFIAAGFTWSDITNVKTLNLGVDADRPNRTQVTEQNLTGDSNSIIARFIQNLQSRCASKLNSGGLVVSNEQLNQNIRAGRWDHSSEIAYRLYTDSTHLTPLQQQEVLTNWAISSYLNDPAEFDLESMAALFRLVNANSSAAGVQYILPTKTARGLLGEFLLRFIRKLSLSMGLTTERSTIQDQLSVISASIATFTQYKLFLRIAFATVGDSKSLTTQTFWEFFAGDSRQAEIRAAFMSLIWKSSLPNVLAQCLTYAPIEISSRKANALAAVADQILQNGKFDLIQSFLDMRGSVSAKPFDLFVATMLSMIPTSSEQAAELSIVGKLNKVDGGEKWRATLSIIPRKSDCPDTIQLTLEQHSPIRFAQGELKHTLIGPFFEPSLVSLEFIANGSDASVFLLEVVCDAFSITGKPSRFITNLDIDLSANYRFQSLGSDEIEEAFAYFPEYQMRGDDYVVRIEDERKIEKALFGRTIRSLWISSPRRSGKTTMLYRILDAFSHKVGRDSLVVYLTLDKSFTSVAEFNSWLWTRVRTLPANKELRALYDNFEELGKNLPWDADAGTFINSLSDCLLTNQVGSRVVFLIDEIDKFAAMHYAGSQRKDTASEIMWQLRHLIGERREVGFVFAGSSAAKRIFVTNSDSPFFNGISLLELTPFGSRTPDEERCAREIVEPIRTRQIYSFPKSSLEHLIWVCAGIPYYMKLVAGATMAVARQSHILIADVNDGLRALLQRGTGVLKLDEMSGEPGSDELRTMAIETGQDKLITLGVLYSIAESYSALGGQPISRNSISAQDAPLITRYSLPKKSIERGLDLCIELGFLKPSTERYGDIEFSIPILGESIKNSCGRLWANIDHELRTIARDEE
ncbi:hypothetical protein [Massilia phyllosphaerae]|uniref:hypothetical protein n=1 Tax=Massilia phyllosphaerae TaxID=3106034 RepID=UPI002B1CDD0C|nr:hypothetical protein [Massilia sp. SGZ-792]